MMVPKVFADYSNAAEFLPPVQFQTLFPPEQSYDEIMSWQSQQANQVTQVSAIMTERDKIAHLLRRAGFGATQVEIDAYQKKGLDDTIKELVNFTPTEPKLEEALGKLNLNLTTANGIQTWWLTRMILTERPLVEKMTMFWHNLFATSIRRVQKAEYMLAQNQFFRANALGDFREILLGISKDPAMLIWLDSNSNRKGAPNENYAREILELFSMGIGNYTETDVKEAARAFTGWHVTRDGKFIFNSNLHDFGSKTFLGVTGNLDGTDIVDIIVKQRANAKYLAKRLFLWFAYDNPEPEVIERLADVYQQNNRGIKAVVEAIFRSEEFYSAKAYYTMIRSPVELVVSGRRLANGNVNIGNMLATMRRTGQELFAPPDVSGWPTGMGWISTSRLLERFNYGGVLATVSANGNDIISQVLAKKLNSPETLVGFLRTAMLHRLLKEERILALIEYARSALGTNPNDRTLANVTRSIMAVITATPEFQME